MVADGQQRRNTGFGGVLNPTSEEAALFSYTCPFKSPKKHSQRRNNPTKHPPSMCTSHHGQTLSRACTPTTAHSPQALAPRLISGQQQCQATSTKPCRSASPPSFLIPGTNQQQLRSAPPHAAALLQSSSRLAAATVQHRTRPRSQRRRRRRTTAPSTTCCTWVPAAGALP